MELSSMKRTFYFTSQEEVEENALPSSWGWFGWQLPLPIQDFILPIQDFILLID